MKTFTDEELDQLTPAQIGALKDRNPDAWLRAIDPHYRAQVNKAKVAAPPVVTAAPAPPAAQTIWVGDVLASPKMTLLDWMKKIGEKIGELFDGFNETMLHLKKKLAAIDDRLASAADAGRVAELQAQLASALTRIVELEKRLAHTESGINGHRSHLAAIEKKIGELRRQ